MTTTFENRKIFYLFLDSLGRIEELLNTLLCLQIEVGGEVAKKSRLQDFKEKWLDKQEVLQLLKISGRTLYNLRKDNKLSEKMIGGKMYFSLADIEKLMK